MNDLYSSTWSTVSVIFIGSSMGLCQGNAGQIALSPKAFAAVEEKCTLEFIAVWYHPLHSLRCDWDHVCMFRRYPHIDFAAVVGGVAVMVWRVDMS